MTRLSGIAAVAALLAVMAGSSQAQAPGYAAERRDMVRQIERVMAASAPMTGISALDARVASAFAKVERHRFVPDALVAHAYADTPLPLGHGQALTQPFLAALMTQALRIEPGSRVFETGTDSGYHAAILAELGAEVFTMEIIEPLHATARLALRDAGYDRVQLRQGDGYYGWAAQAPFDAMLIKESSVDIPPALLQQLKPGGRMVIPLGPADGPQDLTLITRNADGSTSRRAMMTVRFTPFQGGHRI